MRLRLARCTAWVKRWSEAMDFLLTIFKTNIFLLRIFENHIIKQFDEASYMIHLYEIMQCLDIFRMKANQNYIGVVFLGRDKLCNY